MPITTGAPAGASSMPDPNAADPLSSAVQAEEASNPNTVSVRSPSKFGSLMKLLGPIIEGGLVGGFTGKSHPGNGFGAASDYFAQKRQQQIQQQIQQRQTAQAQSNIDERSRANDIAQSRADREDWGQPIQGQDAQGNPAFFVRNRKTGEVRPVGGFTPPDKPDKTNSVMTDQGLMSVTGTTATPVTIPGSPSPSATGIPTGPPQSAGAVQFDGQNFPLNVGRKPGSGGASLIATRTSAGTPLHAPGYGKPQHENDFEQYYEKYLDDNGLDDTAANQLKAHELYSGAGRKPTDDNSGGLTGKAYSKRQGQYLDQLNRGFASSEQQRSKDLAALGKDLTLSPDELAAKRQQIEEDNADRKQTIHQRIADSAEGQGIDVGEVPDYRAQLTGGGQGAGVPNAPPSTARSNGGKVAGPSDVAAWAKRQGISIPAARAQFKAKGYSLQGLPQ